MVYLTPFMIFSMLSCNYSAYKNMVLITKLNGNMDGVSNEGTMTNLHA